jgi:predicted PurR-regulated permease PerM
MEPDIDTKMKQSSIDLMDTLLRAAMIAFLLYFCFKIFAPFIAIMLWGLVLAVMLYPGHQWLAKKMGNRQGRASTLMVLVGCLLIGIPLVYLSSSVAHHIQHAHAAFEANELSIKPPNPNVKEWPVIGERIYKAWDGAHSNFPEFIQSYKSELGAVLKRIVSIAGSTFSSALLFAGALIIAGIMMAWGTMGGNAVGRILNRIAGPVKGPQLKTLSVSTIRSVATGVLGVAVIQGLLFGVGFFLAGVPAAGLLTGIVVLIGIVQLPGVLVAIPTIIYLWAGGDLSLALNIFFSIYFVIASLADNVLKPLLLGRGVDAPMPVILIGALGGMVASGFIGLFLGAVLLAIGYQIFMGWVNSAEDTISSLPEVDSGE